MARKSAPKRPLTALERAWSFPPRLIPWLCAAVILIVASPFLASGWHTAVIPYDWDTMFAGAEITRRAWLNGQHLFSWIPWLCGGLSSASYAFYKIFSPAAFLELAFGAVPGGKLSYVLWQALGAWGTARVLRRLVPEASSTVVAAGALCFALQGFFLNHLRVGHFGFEFVNVFPWIFDGFLRRSVLETAFFMSYTVVSLAIDFAAHLAIYAVLFGIILLARDWREIRYLAKTAISTACLSAIFLLTHGTGVSKFVVHHKEYAQTPLSLFHLLTAHPMELWVCDVDCYFEYGNYIGYGLLLLGVAGLLYAAARKYRVTDQLLWIVAAVFSFLVALGPFAFWAPWSVIERVPVLQNMQVNTRFLVELGFFLIIGWATILSLIRYRSIQAVLVVLTIAPLLSFARASYSVAATGPLLPDLRGDERAQPLMLAVGDARRESYESIARGIVNTSCYIALPFDPSPNLKPGSGMLLSGPGGSALEWDGSRWIISAGAVKAGSKWVLNQNFDPQLQAFDGNGRRLDVTSEGGVLGVVAPFDLSGGSRISVGLEPTPLERGVSFVTLGSWMVFLAFAAASVMGSRKLRR